MIIKLKNLVLPSYNLFIITAALLAVATLFYRKERADFHLHDTYIVFPFVYVLWLVAIGLLVMWMLYRATARILLSPFLTAAHVASTLLWVLAYFSAILWQPGVGHAFQRKMYYSTDPVMEAYNQIAIVALVLSLIFLLGQLAFVINIVGGGIKSLVGYVGKNYKRALDVNE